jgi:hypothetical protein
MPILTSNPDASVQVHCVREVRVGVPYEIRDDVRRFYTVVVGLRRWPPYAQIPGGCGFGDPWCGLHLQYRHDPTVDPMRRRFGLAVNSLDRFERRLRAYDWSYRRLQGLTAGEQVIRFHDPAGHQVEVRQFRPL